MATNNSSSISINVASSVFNNGDGSNAASPTNGNAKLSRRQRQRRNKKERIAKERAQAKQENSGEAKKDVPARADSSESKSTKTQPQRQNQKKGGNVTDGAKNGPPNTTAGTSQGAPKLKDVTNSNFTVSQDEKISRTKARRLRRKRKKQQYRDEPKINGGEIDTGSSFEDGVATQSEGDPRLPRNKKLTDDTVSPEQAPRSEIKPEPSAQKPAIEVKNAHDTVALVSNKTLPKNMSASGVPSNEKPEPVEASPVDRAVAGATSGVSVQTTPSETQVVSKAANTMLEKKLVSNSKKISSERSALAYAEELKNETENCECQACSIM